MTKEKLLFAMNISTKLAVEELVRQTKEPQEKVLLDFMKSNTAKMLYVDSTNSGRMGQVP